MTDIDMTIRHIIVLVSDPSVEIQCGVMAFVRLCHVFQAFWKAQHYLMVCLLERNGRRQGKREYGLCTSYDI